jgi:ADP-L-glycero-D-manno-heptose 6-epimerase
MNQYAFSKWIMEKEMPEAVILRLFNVYGPNEYHKGRMASVILNWAAQIKKDGVFKVFENSSAYKRDFIWVEDVARTVHHFVDDYRPGVYDLGTGHSVDFDTVADAVASNATGIKTYVEMPDDLKKQYQTDTRANTDALTAAGVDVSSFLTVDEGISRYFQYLEKGLFY